MRLSKSKKRKAKVNGDSKDKIVKIKVSDNKIGNNKIERKKNYQKTS